MFNLFRSSRVVAARPSTRVTLNLEGFEARIVPTVETIQVSVMSHVGVAVPPQIGNFQVEWIDTGVYELTGSVNTTNPAGMVVTFGGSVESISGKTVTVNADGTFKLRVTIGPNESGTITAITTDGHGQPSNLAITFIFPN